MHEVLIVLVIAIIVIIQIAVFITAITRINNFVNLFPTKQQLKIKKYYIPEDILGKITLQDLYKSGDLYADPTDTRKQFKPTIEAIAKEVDKSQNLCMCFHPFPDENMHCSVCGLPVDPYRSVLN